MKTFIYSFLIYCTLRLSAASLFPSGAEGFLAAFGDFNNDKFADIVVVNNVKSDGIHSLSIFYFKGAEDSPGVERSDHNLALIGSPVVVAVIPGDFNGDSALDIVVLYKEGTAATVLKLGVFWHSTTSSKVFETFAVSEGLVFSSQPVVVDVNGDQIPDLLGQVDNEVVIVSTGGGSKNFKNSSFDVISDARPAELLPDFAHMFAHVTDNPQPDIVLGVKNGDKKSLEVWSAQRPQSDYYLKYSKEFPEGSTLIGNPSVCDLNLDGKPEVVIPICEGASCAKSKIYYREMETEDSSWRLMHSFSDAAEAQSSPLRKFKVESEFGGIENNLFLRVADVNFDGYPDFLVVLEDNDGVSELSVLTNIECEGGNDVVCNSERGISSSTVKVPNVQIATFFDFHENGNNDIIYSTYSDGKFFLGSREISDKGDEAFLKVFVTGGLCGPETYNCLFDDINYGANIPGPTLSYSTTGASGKPRYSIATQLSQASHFALQSPFVIFGLGQTPNFVESLTITLASSKKVVGTRTMVNVIPNSQLILIPHPPNDPSNWTFQLLLTPSDILWKFATALGGVVVVLAFFVALLQYQEKREDDREKRQDAHKFHFDAM